MKKKAPKFHELLSVSSKSREEVFRDFLSMVISALAAGRDEDRYYQAIEGYTTDEVQQLSRAFGVMVMDMEAGKHEGDVLGQYFTEFITRGQNGQFFTPSAVTQMMADLVIQPSDDVKNVVDPACGSGRTLLAAGRIDRSNNFFGADVDQRCAMMTAINMCLNDMPGEVAWMDTLRMKVFWAWRITKVGLLKVPIITSLTPEQSVFHSNTELREKLSAGSQQQLLF